ncbi:serine hydrolase [Paraburkholderia sediminicola]|uniref:serine hydrolase n=1 Tax=Paraburkholderia sediminicola TaxID=458836 RepID=UPI0038B9DBB7
MTRPKWPLRDLPSATPATPPLPPQDSGTDWVTNQIELLARRCGAVVGVCAQEIGGPWRVEYQAQRRFFMASTFKVALAATVLQAVGRGELSLDEVIEVPRARHMVGSGVIMPAFVHEGLALSVVNLLEVMMSESDNTATDVLMARIGGPQCVQQWLAEVGVQGMRVDRNIDRMVRDFCALGDEGTPLEAAARMFSAPGFDPESVFDFNARLEADDRDTTTPAGMADLLSGLATGQFLSVASTTLLEGMMLRVRGARSLRLLARLPAGTPVAHKPGTAAGVINDAGWITLPDGRRFVAAVFSRHGLTPRVQREQMVEEVGRLLYSAFAEAPQR